MIPEVVFADPEPVGLALMLGDLIAQNLLRDPGRARLLLPALVSIAASDAGVAATLRIGPGRVLVAGGAHPRAQIHVRAPADRLLALTDTPLRLGLPDLLSREGRGLVADVVCRRIRIGGMMSHPCRLARLTMLLSVR